MRVFVLCTGRCGSVTLSRAASHATNFTAGHETRCHMIGADRFDYPDGHIEVDNRLSWMLGRLNTTIVPEDRFVHLLRDREAVAQSHLARYDFGIMLAYRSQILMRAPQLSSDVAPIDFCRDYVDTVTENIRHFLADKEHVMTIQLENLQQDFAMFWDWIGATGDRQAALDTCLVRHNETRTKPRKPNTRKSRKTRSRPST